MVTVSSIFALVALVAAFMIGRHTVNKSQLPRPFDIVAYVMLALGVLIAVFNTGGKSMMGGMGGMGFGGGGYGAF